MLLDDSILNDSPLNDLGIDPMFTAQALLDDDGAVISPQYVGTADTGELYPAQIKTEY